MQIAQELAGYYAWAAPICCAAPWARRSGRRWTPSARAFVDGAVGARREEAGKASQIFDQVNKFAGYGFNKSHAAAYALVAYQTAYLKANYPVEFLAASMTLRPRQHRQAERLPPGAGRASACPAAAA